MTKLSDTLKGALLMMGAMIGFTFNDGFMRVALETLPLYQAVFLRGIFIIPALLVLALRARAFQSKPAPKDRWRIRLRTLAEIVGTFLFLTALTRLPFANISAIMQVIPLAVTLAAALFLKSPIGWRRIGAILIGFIGVLIVVRPGTEGFNTASLLILAVVGIVVVRDLASKTLSANIPSTSVALHAAIGLSLVNGALMLTEPLATVGVKEWLCLIAAALILTFGYICSIATMRIGDLATIAPFRYTALLWSILIGLLFFNEIPDRWTLIGSAIIVAMGVFSLYRERQISKTL